MEILTILLSGLLSLASGGGLVLDAITANQIRSQVVSLEEQAIRVDNSPSYQIAQGKVQKVRIATRGVIIKPDLRISVLELETDQVNLDPSKLKFKSIDGLRESLKEPLQGAVKLILTEVDLNKALQSPEIMANLQKALNRLIVRKAGSTNIAYQLSDLQIKLLPANRLGVQFKLSRPVTNSELKSTNNTPRVSPTSSRSRELAMALELEVQVLNGKIIRLIKPEGTVNGRPMSPRLLKGFAEGISDRLNLNVLETNGILARILQLQIDEDKLELVSFAILETKALPLSSKEIKAIP